MNQTTATKNILKISLISIVLLLSFIFIGLFHQADAMLLINGGGGGGGSGTTGGSGGTPSVDEAVDAIMSGEPLPGTTDVSDPYGDTLPSGSYQMSPGVYHPGHSGGSTGGPSGGTIGSGDVSEEETWTEYPGNITYPEDDSGPSGGTIGDDPDPDPPEPEPDTCCEKRCQDNDCDNVCGLTPPCHDQCNNDLDCCSHQCSPSGKTTCCNNNQEKVCGDHDSDPCREWSSCSNCDSPRWSTINTYTCCKGDQLCTACKDQEWLEYSCSGGSCSPQVTNTRTIKQSCSSCNDGQWCSVGDGCSGGSCDSTSPRDCSDTNSCTIDSCDEANDVCDHNLVCDGTTCPIAPEGVDSTDYCNSCDHCGDDFCNCGEDAPSCPADCNEPPYSEGYDVEEPTDNQFCRASKGEIVVNYVPKWTFKDDLDDYDDTMQAYQIKIRDESNNTGKWKIDSSAPDGGTVKRPLEVRTDDRLTSDPDESLHLEYNQDYDWQVKVQDSIGAFNSWSGWSSWQSFSVKPRYPRAQFSYTPDGPSINTEINFDATDSEVYDGTQARLSWDFDNDGSWEITDTTSKTTTHSYSETGEYTVRLRVEDSSPETSACFKDKTIKVKPKQGPREEVIPR